MSDLAALAALGTAPIPGENPAGVSARYEPEFEKLAAEISKLESVEGRAGLHWDAVVEPASAILASKSKDLLVASYLTLGLLQEDGYAGLATGLGLCRDLLATFWETLFPEKSRMRARAQALQWMAERLPSYLTERGDASKSDREPLQAAVAALTAISDFARGHFEDGGPSFGELQNAVENKLASVPADEPPPSGEPAPSESTSDSPSSSSDASAPASEAPPPPKEMDSPDAAREALAEMRERRVKAAGLLREANPADPLPYRLLRAAAWEDLLEAPPSKDGTSEQPGGDSGFAAQAEERLEKGEYAAVIADCESRLSSDRLWLDLNFWSFRAMEGLGRPYLAARKALGEETARLARSIPALLDLKFGDGTPMASERARLWIAHELGALPPKAAADGVEAAASEARKLAARKAFPEAAALLERESRSGAGRRERFRARLYLAKLCAESGRADLALPLFEGLDEESRKGALEEWEPSLAAEVVKGLWACHKAAGAAEKAADARARLCRLDLSAALAADGVKT